MRSQTQSSWLYDCTVHSIPDTEKKSIPSIQYLVFISREITRNITCWSSVSHGCRVQKNVLSRDRKSGNKHRKTKWYIQIVNAPVVVFMSCRCCTNCCIIVELPNSVSRTHSTNLIPSFTSLAYIRFCI